MYLVPLETICVVGLVGIVRERGVPRADGALSWWGREEHTRKLVQDELTAENLADNSDEV